MTTTINHAIVNIPVSDRSRTILEDLTVEITALNAFDDQIPIVIHAGEFETNIYTVSDWFVLPGPDNRNRLYFTCKTRRGNWHFSRKTQEKFRILKDGVPIEKLLFELEDAYQTSSHTKVYHVVCKIGDWGTHTKFILASSLEDAEKEFFKYPRRLSPTSKLVPSEQIRILRIDEVRDPSLVESLGEKESNNKGEWATYPWD